MVAMPWAGQGVFEPKLARLVSRVDTYRQRGYRVSLVGASAGASAVLNAYSQRKEEVQGVAYICGKVNYPNTVSAQTYVQNPAFKTSMQQLQNNLSLLVEADKCRLSSFYSSADTTVPYADTVIEGILEQRLPSLGHMWSILYSLSIGSGKLLQTLRR
jgi:pimeloyl-ACP methyl ester carboxylesterase